MTSAVQLEPSSPETLEISGLSEKSQLQIVVEEYLSYACNMPGTVLSSEVNAVHRTDKETARPRLPS